MREWQSLKTTYPDSVKIAGVSEGAETLYTRLIAKADDLGRAPGNLRALLGLVYARRPDVDERILAQRVGELEAAGLVQTYESGGDPVLALVNVTRQGVRADRPLVSAFPAPEGGCPTPVRHPSDTRPTGVGHEMENENEKENEKKNPPTPRGGQGGASEGMSDLLRFDPVYEPIVSPALRKRLTEWSLSLEADPRFKVPRGPQARRWLNLLLRWRLEGVPESDLEWAVAKAIEGGHRGCWGKLVDPRELPRPQNGVHREDEKARKRREEIEEMERRCRETARGGAS